MFLQGKGYRFFFKYHFVLCFLSILFSIFTFFATIGYSLIADQGRLSPGFDFTSSISGTVLVFPHPDHGAIQTEVYVTRAFLHHAVYMSSVRIYSYTYTGMLYVKRPCCETRNENHTLSCKIWIDNSP